MTKIKRFKKDDVCPDCNSSALVMSLQTGNAKIYGCLHCRNAQGIHLKIKDAKIAWEAYKKLKLKD